MQYVVATPRLFSLWACKLTSAQVSFMFSFVYWCRIYKVLLWLLCTGERISNIVWMWPNFDINVFIKFSALDIKLLVSWFISLILVISPYSVSTFIENNPLCVTFWLEVRTWLKMRKKRKKRKSHIRGSRISNVLGEHVDPRPLRRTCGFVRPQACYPNII